MGIMTALLVLVTATGGCVDDPTDPLPPDPIEAPWPCASRTVWAATGMETVQRYEWDAHHNLVRKEDGAERFSARFDPTGQIAIEESREWPATDGTGANRQTIRRDVEDGRITREQWSNDFDGFEGEGSTTFRYERGLLVEKHTVAGSYVDVLTSVWYEEPDTRVESDEVRSGPPGGLRIWKGEPWYELHDIRVTETIVARDLDAQGREVRVKRWSRGDLDYDEVVDIERAPSGAPVREVWVSKDDRSRTVTYQTDCSP
jgi:hypothetical protein